MASNLELPTIEIGYSPLRLVGLIGAGVLMTVASASLAFQWIAIGGSGPAGTLRGAVGVVAGYVGLAFFGLGTVAAVWLWRRVEGPIVVISRDGIRDRRIAEEVIPWKLVEDISHQNRERFLLLRLSRAADYIRFHIGPKRHPIQLTNRTLGVDKVQIGTAGFNVTTEMLLETCRTYHAAARAT
ncbi:STM3941 family protein [Bradyrhizobium japonicum]|uniref:STM3941 family protein n=1 Tax=Bradyrhizobium japonicum TaxID=375 RepID=UPI0024BF911C|nr:STM3941 family protein [Bradyrhizobium japonicum]